MPSKRDWNRISRRGHDHRESRRREIEQVQRELTDCIGCGCLSLRRCYVLDPSDGLAESGPGPQHLLHPETPGE
ncbi:MerR family transcriptional regulator [Nocardia canadensis]|nr:hypothetical protein [Nocardia canadensis]